MAEQWADISEADKGQCALEAEHRNQAARRPSIAEAPPADPQPATCAFPRHSAVPVDSHIWRHLDIDV